MKAILISHVGNSRDNQEDNAMFDDGFYIGAEQIRNISETKQAYRLKEEKEQGKDFLFAVSDGMGGHACGEVASYTAVKYLADNLGRVLQADNESLVAEIAELNRAVVREADRDPSRNGMGATLCGVLQRENRLVGFNVGDSRLYGYSDGELKQLSTDHTEGQRLLGLKLLTEEELKTFPYRKRLCKCVGIRNELVADVFDIEAIGEGSALLICSDGLTDTLSNEEITRILNEKTSIEERGDALLGEALERNAGFGDNITIILIEL